MKKLIILAAALALGATVAQAQDKKAEPSTMQKVQKAGADNTAATNKAKADKKAADEARSQANKEARDKRAAERKAKKEAKKKAKMDAKK
jgi:hypothetical protein